jgi:hypothetical protein
MVINPTAAIVAATPTVKQPTINNPTNIIFSDSANNKIKVTAGHGIIPIEIIRGH